MPGVQPIDYVPDGPSGRMIPLYSQASPGISGAIGDAIRALSMALAPKSITQIAARNRMLENQGEGNQQNVQGQQQASPNNSTDLGNQF